MRVQNHRRRLSYKLWLIALAASLLFLTARCSFKKNQPDYPYPDEARVEKSFFEKKQPNGSVKLKTFLAGWTPEQSAGTFSRAILVHYNMAEHTNVVFEVEEKKLVGKKIIASFMTDTEDCLDRDSAAAKACRSRWPNVLVIPINSHYYFERQKDSRGRETDVYTENSSRSHWSARPYMNLELRSLVISEWGSSLGFAGTVVDGIEDIEWDKEKGFLGFTLESRSHMYDYGSYIQGKFRYNFLEFEHNKDFKTVPYRHSNSKYINVLHVIGKDVGGDPTNPVMYAAHWDTKKKHTIYLHGFPKEYEDLGIKSVEEWNDVFQKAGRGRPFEAKVSDRKYPFDLRYPTIVWEADRRLSATAPLGVGLALADVRNGDIRWGGVTVWAGMIQEYVNRSSPNAAAIGMAEATGQKPIVQLSLMEPEQILPGLSSAVPSELLNMESYEEIRADLIKQIQSEKSRTEQFLQATPEQLMALAKQQAPTEDEAGEAALNPIAQMKEALANPGSLTLPMITDQLNEQKENLAQLLTLKAPNSERLVVDEMVSGLQKFASGVKTMAQQIGPMEKVFTTDYVQTLIQMPKLHESMAHIPSDNHVEMKRLRDSGMLGSLNRREIIDLVQNQGLSEMNKASFCTDRHLYDVIDGYQQGISQANIDKEAAFRSVMKDLLLHEVGHMLGLGHNFKENILPERGTLPNVSKKAGLYKDFSMDELEKAAKDHNKNYTTVMGYKDGAVDVLMKEEDIVPGPADVMSIEFLYNGRYPIYPVDAKGEGDYEFAFLTTDGWILENIQHKGKTYRPAFFAACNDVTATRGNDPYCARWDRGYNASTIVQNRFDSFRGNMISQLTAFTDTLKGDHYRFLEYYLWVRSLTTFGRSRIFYDYMRQKYEPEIRALIAGGSEAGLQNLLQFGDTCRAMSAGEPTENTQLVTLFKAKPELYDLCLASSILMSEANQLMQLPGKDYTQIDYRNQFTSLARGGEAKMHFGRIFGTWKELARMPIKLSALMTLTSPYPYSQYGAWAIPISEYSRADGGYHLSTLFAKDFTAAVAAGTEMNLNLGNTGLNDNTTIGRTVMAMGYYLRSSMFSNDVLTVGTPYIKNIRNQTAFRYSYSIVEVTKDDEEGKEIARNFTGMIYNQFTRGPEKVPEIYIFTQDRVVMRPPPGSLMLQVTPVRWYSGSSGYFYALKMDYNDEFFDRLKTNSVRRTLNETYQDVTKKCIEGDGDVKNGLRFHFNKDVDEAVFPGFRFPDLIHEKDRLRIEFLTSVEDEFDKYYTSERFSPKPRREQCDDALRGQALIVMAASVLNGYYFYDLYDYMEKDLSW